MHPDRVTGSRPEKGPCTRTNPPKTPKTQGRSDAQDDSCRPREAHDEDAAGMEMTNAPAGPIGSFRGMSVGLTGFEPATP
jgi:hypothetical protein